MYITSGMQFLQAYFYKCAVYINPLKILLDDLGGTTILTVGVGCGGPG